MAAERDGMHEDGGSICWTEGSGKIRLFACARRTAEYFPVLALSICRPLWIPRIESSNMQLYPPAENRRSAGQQRKAAYSASGAGVPHSAQA